MLNDHKRFQEDDSEKHKLNNHGNGAFIRND